MRQFEVRAVLTDTISVLRLNPVVLGTLALFASGVYLLIEYYFVEAEEVLRLHFAIQLTIILAGTVLAFGLMTIAAICATYRFYRGEPATFGECIGIGIRFLPRISGFLVVYGFLVSVAGMLFVIPGLYVAILFWVLAPVALMERTGFVEGFKRAADLTQNARWPIFILLLIIVGLSIVISIPLLFLPLDSLVTKLFDWMFVALYTALASAATAVSYFYLRSSKTRLSIEEIVTANDG